MASLHITSFGGINTEIAARNSRIDIAQIAHNCLLWDGTLRPIASWVSKQGGLVERYTLEAKNGELVTSNLLSAQHLDSSTYVSGTVVGLNPSVVDVDRSNICYQNAFTQIDSIQEVGVAPPVMSNDTIVNYTQEFSSKKPVNRIYAASLVRDNYGRLEESTLILIPNQSPQSVIYEGDTCAITLRIADAPIREKCYVRIYRSISGMDTGQSVANELDTEWFLVGEIKAYVAYLAGIFREYVFIDTGTVTDDPMDVYLASRFYPPIKYTYKYLGSTESGWLVASTESGDIGVSERFMTHAWPTENYLHLPANITGMAVHYDNAYIGTDKEPYIISIASGEALPTQLHAKPFAEAYACLPGTMTRAAGGALYASSAGVVALSQEGMRLVSAGTASGVRPLYHVEYVDTTATPEQAKCVDLDFSDTIYGAYYRGIYYGFCLLPMDNTVPPPEPVFISKGYMFDAGSSLDGDHPQQKLVTFDGPPGKVISHTITNSGLAVLSNNAVWEMPLPLMNDKTSYKMAKKACYQWKSRKFVFPGIITMGAAKVVHDGGFVRLKIYIDCVCTYDTVVPDCRAFTLPMHMSGVEWEVEVHGTAAVHEIHVAPTIEELTEQ